MGDGIADLEVEFLGFLQAQRNRCRYLKHLASYTRLVMVILHQALMGADLGVNCRDHYAYGGSLDNVSGIRTQVPLMDHRVHRNEKFTQSPSPTRASCDVSSAPDSDCVINLRR